MYVITIKRKDGTIECVYRQSKHDACQIASLARRQGKTVIGLRDTSREPKKVHSDPTKSGAVQLELFPDLFKSQKGK